MRKKLDVDMYVSICILYVQHVFQNSLSYKIWPMPLYHSQSVPLHAMFIFLSMLLLLLFLLPGMPSPEPFTSLNSTT